MLDLSNVILSLSIDFSSGDIFQVGVITPLKLTIDLEGVEVGGAKNNVHLLRS